MQNKFYSLPTPIGIIGIERKTDTDQWSLFWGSGELHSAHLEYKNKLNSSADTELLLLILIPYFLFPVNFIIFSYFINEVNKKTTPP